MKKLSVAYSALPDARSAAHELAERLGDVEARLVVFFASSSYPPAEIALQMKASFGGARTFGCTTSGELSGGAMRKGTVVAIALSGEVVSSVAIAVVEDISGENNVKKALQSLEAQLGTPLASLNPNREVGVVLTDGMSASEERVMDRLGVLTDIPFVGGSAGDDLAFTRTHLFVDGAAYTNAAVLALFQTSTPLEILKTQSFRVLPKRLVVTRVDEATRTVYEFNGRPAALEYADAIGQSRADAEKFFKHHPVGLIGDGELFVRSPQRFSGDHMIFFCSVKEGMELHLLESTDIVGDTRAVLAQKNEERAIAGVINFHCILRTLELEERGETEAYGAVFSQIPTVGFSTYGEQYLGHINQTSTMILIR